jgi:hypothetical protein
MHGKTMLRLATWTIWRLNIAISFLLATDFLGLNVATKPISSALAFCGEPVVIKQRGNSA